MVNKILHSVTNRAGGFCDPAFPASAVFNPQADTPESVKLRALLGVDRRDSDYHIFAVLGAIEAYPDIFYSFEDRDRTYRLENFVTPTPVVYGGVAGPDHLGAPQLNPLAHEAPVPATFELAYIDAGFGVLTYGGRRQVIPVTVSGDQVFPAWPDDFGVSGGFTATWDASAKIGVRGWPRRFPYEVLAARLRDDVSKNVFLQQHGLVEHFHLAVDPVKQVAIAALALGLSNTSVYE